MCAFQDWELEFVDSLQDFGRTGEGEDRLMWRPKRNGKFNFCSFYETLRGLSGRQFPWKNIW